MIGPFSLHFFLPNIYFSKPRFVYPCSTSKALFKLNIRKASKVFSPSSLRQNIIFVISLIPCCELKLKLARGLLLNGNHLMKLIWYDELTRDHIECRRRNLLFGSSSRDWAKQKFCAKFVKRRTFARFSSLEIQPLQCQGICWRDTTLLGPRQRQFRLCLDLFRHKQNL